MKFPSFNRRRTLIDCGIVFGLHAILLQVMAHTRIVERVMALQFNAGELAIILTFFLSRLLAYFLVPAVLGALAADGILRRLTRRAP